LHNIWQDLPEARAVGSDWVSASKPKKQPSVEEQRSKPHGDRAKHSGRGRGDNSRAARPAQKTQTAPSVVSAPAVVPAPAASANIAVGVSEHLVEANRSSVRTEGASVRIDVNSASAVSATGRSAWAGKSLAERLKRQEAEKLEAELKKQAEVESAQRAVEAKLAEVVLETQTTPAEPHRSKSSRPKRGKKNVDLKSSEEPTEDNSANIDTPIVVIEHIEEKKELENVHPIVHEEPDSVYIAPAAEAVFVEPSEAQSEPFTESEKPVERIPSPKALLKLGKWSTAEIPERSTFQFGSFGNVVSSEESVSSSSTSAWAVESDAERSLEWSSTTGVPLAPSVSSQSATSNLNALFPPSKVLPAVGLDSADSKPQAPPGLDNQAPGKSNGSARGIVQTARKHEPSPHQQPYNSQYSQYQQPPGIAVPPRSYYPPYEQYSFAPVAAPTSSTTVGAGGVTGTSATNTSSGGAQSQSQQPQFPPGMTPYGYYPQYYPQQYFYGQPQSYYPQGRGYPPRPYPDLPYGGPGSIYPEVYQGGQFPEGQVSYGSVPLHAIPGSSAPGANGGKQSKTNSVGSSQLTGSTPQEQPIIAHPQQYYAPYPRGGAEWPTPWPTPFPQPSAAPQQSAGFTQQGGSSGHSQSTSATREPQRSQTSSNAYGGSSSFGGRNAPSSSSANPHGW